VLGLLNRTALGRGGPPTGRPPVENVKETQPPSKASLSGHVATVSANTLL
jgi:hypothetical protein